MSYTVVEDGDRIRIPIYVRSPEYVDPGPRAFAKVQYEVTPLDITYRGDLKGSLQGGFARFFDPDDPFLTLNFWALDDGVAEPARDFRVTVTQTIGNDAPTSSNLGRSTDVTIDQFVVSVVDPREEGVGNVHFQGVSTWTWTVDWDGSPQVDEVGELGLVERKDAGDDDNMAFSAYIDANRYGQNGEASPISSTDLLARFERNDAGGWDFTLGRPMVNGFGEVRVYQMIANASFEDGADDISGRAVNYISFGADLTMSPNSSSSSSVVEAVEIEWFEDFLSLQIVAATYQFFTNRIPERSGLEYLIASDVNENDLNDPYYEQFNVENKFFNFANNLGSFGEGADSFADRFSILTFEQAVLSAYDQIVGKSVAEEAGIDYESAIAFFMNSYGYYVDVASERVVPSGIALDQAVKIVMIGSLLNEALKADIGPYADALGTFANEIALTGHSPFFGESVL